MDLWPNNYHDYVYLCPLSKPFLALFEILPTLS